MKLARLTMTCSSGRARFLSMRLLQARFLSMRLLHLSKPLATLSVLSFRTHTNSSDHGGQHPQGPL